MSSYNPFAGYASKQVEERQVAAEKKANSVPTGTIPEIEDWVGDDKDKAQRVLDEENKHPKPRKSLIKTLEDIING